MTTFFIDHQCPQCGAPAILEETDRLYRCGYCKISSYLIQNGVFRYVFPHNAPSGKQVYYVPYWRFKGMYFYCTISGFKHRFLDLSYQAFESALFPISLGVRSQALKLAFATPAVQGRFIRPELPIQRVMRIFEDRYRKQISQTIFHQEFVGETISLIYSPFTSKDVLYDAVLNKPVCSCVEDIDSLASESPLWPVKFVPNLCPDCGWDMEGEKDSLILICRNCNSVWLPRHNGFKKIAFAIVPGKGDVFLPFWQIYATALGVNLNSYADFVKLANLPKVIQAGWHSQPFRFWSLAFKVRPNSFMQLNCAITLAQPKAKKIRCLPEAAIQPVTLPIAEAVESLKITLGDLARPQKHFLPQLSNIQIKPQKFQMVFIPFHETSHEYHNSDLGLAVNKSQLTLASNL